MPVLAPKALVADLAQALALRMQGAADPAVGAIVAKVAGGTPTTAAEKVALAQAFMRSQGRDALLDYRAQQAAQAVRDGDAARDW